MNKIKVDLKINHKEIKLNPFVKETIFNTVLGLLKSLKGVKDIKKVSLYLSKHRQSSAGSTRG